MNLLCHCAADEVQTNHFIYHMHQCACGHVDAFASAVLWSFIFLTPLFFSHFKLVIKKNTCISLSIALYATKSTNSTFDALDEVLAQFFRKTLAVQNKSTTTRWRSVFKTCHSLACTFNWCRWINTLRAPLYIFESSYSLLYSTFIQSSLRK